MTGTVDERPPPVASALAVLLAVGVVALVGDTATQRFALAGTVGGVVLVFVGGRLPDGGTGAPIAGNLIAVLGLGVAGVSAVYGATAATGYGQMTELLPGLAGVVLLSLGVLPVHERYAGWIVSAGLGALLAGVALSGIFARSTPVEVLVAGALAVLAWDVAIHGIGLGRQLGGDARTWPVELVHAGGTACYGGGIVVVGAVVYDVGASGLPLATLVLLLVAAVTLTVALYD